MTSAEEPFTALATCCNNVGSRTPIKQASANTKIRIEPSLRLRRAIHNGDQLLTARILKSHPTLLHNPDYTAAGHSNTSLHLASSLGHLAIVQHLLHLGHEATGISLNEEYQTPLILAAQEGHTDTVLALCQSGVADVGRQDGRGRDAVMEASRGGHDTCLQILLTYAPAPSPLFARQFTGIISPSELEKLRNSNDSETNARLLLSHADHEGNTALHFASSNGHLLVLRTLLAAGADSERRNAWSWTAVSYSATVAAEVYFKGLVAEVQRRRDQRREAEVNGKGGALRIVGRDVDEV